MGRRSLKIPSNSEYPKVVFLKGERYKIVFVKNFKYLGLTDSEQRVIKIRDGMSRNETFRTLIHELLHFIEFEWPVKLKHKTVYQLEEAIFTLLVDNFL